MANEIPMPAPQPEPTVRDRMFWLAVYIVLCGINFIVQRGIATLRIGYGPIRIKTNETRLRARQNANRCPYHSIDERG